MYLTDHCYLHVQSRIFHITDTYKLDISPPHLSVKKDRILNPKSTTDYITLLLTV